MTAEPTLTQEKVAEDLLFPLFRCIEEGYKERYYRDIWDQYEHAVRSASYTSKVPMFLENLKNRIPLHIQSQYLNQINSVLQAGADRQLLTWLRDETSYLILLTRVLNQDRKAAKS